MISPRSGIRFRRGLAPRLVSSLILVVASVAFTAGPALATPYDCNKCDGGNILLLLPDVCHWVNDGESGFTDCVDTSGCRLLGDSCVGNSGGSGGGGGSVGGGDDTCTGGAYCPPECFSCDPNAV